MSEPLFQQFARDILQLHQRTVISWLAVPQAEDTAVFTSPYAHIDGCYYFAIPDSCPSLQPQNGIVLIEDENAEIRLSWIGSTREVSCKECVYQDACAALQRRGHYASHIENSRLLELCPQQGHLSIPNQCDSALSPQLLQRALYPAYERLHQLTG